MEHLFVINPQSFGTNLRGVRESMDAITAEIKAYFVGKEEKYTIHISRYPRNAIVAIRRYFKNLAADTRVRVYAVGGDGMAFDCLNGIVGMSNVELAIIPYGTGSDFVRAFGPEHYLEFRNLTAQTSASTIPVDVIKCNGKYALNFCSVGVESVAAIKIIPLFKRFKRLRRSFPFFNRVFFLIGAILAQFEKRVIGQEYGIFADGENVSGSYLGINIANAPYYGDGLSAVSSAVPDDGLMDMLITKKMHIFAAFASLAKFVSGGWRLLSKHFIFRRIKQVSIRSTKPLSVNLDGEVFFDTFLDIEILPHLVNIVNVTGAGFKRLDKPFSEDSAKEGGVRFHE
jgi:diacylglycerol kinase family enzyme